MELTKEQIHKVAHYLNVKHITYIDLRMEVLDHIVSDIETKMM
ncbi:MAG: ribosomal protein S13, partial [Patiriisocius sp.]